MRGRLTGPLSAGETRAFIVVAAAEMLNCKHQGCNKYPTFGVESTKKKERCAQHALEGMVDVMNMRCA